MIKAVIWDLGGVLIRPDNTAHLRKWEDRLGLSLGQLMETVFARPTAHLAYIGQATPDQVWQEVAQELNLSAADVETLKADLWQVAVWNQELIAFSRSLKPQYKIALITGAWADLRQNLDVSINELFDLIVISGEEGVGKPAPVIFQRTLSRLGIAAAEAIFIDDWLDSVEGARAVGMHALQFIPDRNIIAEISRIIEEHK